jgi:uncharacterized membrane protein YeaQ/YmgE (transglycosylase-associated protein family)
VTSRARDVDPFLVEISSEFKVQVESLLSFLIIGAIAGWIAGKLMRGGGFGILGNMVLGVLGAVIGGFVFGMVGVTAGGLMGSLVTAVIGAAILLFVVGLFKKD